MSAMDLFWLFFMLSALQPLLRQRMLEAMRMRKIGQLERKRNSRVILLVHRQETMRLLGFPIMRYIDVNDSEEVLRAIQMTDSEIPLDIVLHTPGGSSSRRRRSSARSAPQGEGHGLRAALRHVRRNADRAGRRRDRNVPALGSRPSRLGWFLRHHD